MDTRSALKWVAWIVALLLIAGVAQAQFRTSAAERDALEWRGRAETHQMQREAAESLSAIVLADYGTMVGRVAATQDSLSVEREARRTDHRESAATFDSLVASVPDTATTVPRAVFDSVVVASRDKDTAAERIMATLQTAFDNERTMRIAAEGGWAHDRERARVATLEALAWKNTAESWQRAARPSFFLRIKQDAGLVAGGVAIGAVACLFLCG